CARWDSALAVAGDYW
nr:immunoglobulin heavy chain junction region [Macaca mulatta]MOW86881.1 immunoglobulin heavy chain junction region [Macaca mulatta]MOW87203.1 immunoglobulin heavy chain junction region [Macaca mulatta]MOW88205.1 immunoglobulin heavy chain junction region [Macaca mulatta]MOW91543.1 immunoglobulin heavy chain junction region [Macaca mulatta]